MRRSMSFSWTPLAAGDLGEESRSVEAGRAELEMRRPRARERAGAEERASQIGAAAARAADHSLGRTAERCAASGEDAGLPEHRRRGRIDLELELITGRAVERVPGVGADLGTDAEVSQQAERTPRDRGAREVELHRELTASVQMPRPRGVRESRELCQRTAAAGRLDRGKLVAELVRPRHLRARAACACTRGRARRTSRSRSPRPLDGTARTAKGGCARRRFPRRGRRADAPRGRRARRR